MGTERDFKVKKGLIVTEDIELGHASDTTIARASAGQITVEGTAVVLAGGALGTPASGVLTNATGLPTTSLTGTITNAQLAGSISNTKLLSGIDADKLTTGTLPIARIASSAIVESKIASGAITTQKIGTDQITNAKMADNSIDSGQILADAVIEAKIADDAVTGAKVSGFAVANTQIGAGSLGVEISSSVTTIICASQAQADTFPSSGVIDIGSEKIKYTGKQLRNLTGLIRGHKGTTATGHNINTTFKTEHEKQITLGGSKTLEIKQFEGADATNATDLAGGLVPFAGTADISKFLRGDGAWVTLGGGSGTVTSVTAGTGMTQTGTSTVNPTLNVGGLTVSELAAGSLQISSESFADNDTSLMTSAAIQDKILSYGYNNYTHTTNANLTGDVTSVGNATTIATDAVDIAMLSATGTASSSTYLRGDNTWATVSSGGATAIDGLSDAVFNNTLGSLALGSGAMDDVSFNSSWSVGVGKEALADLEAGFSNIGIGYQAGKAISSGTYNVMIGAQTASMNAVTGSYNLGIGLQSLRRLSSGTNNIGIGSGTLESLTTGQRNIALGKSAMKDTTGNDNIAIGDLALYANTSGLRNIGIGTGAYNGATSENDNIAIGYAALGATLNGGEKNLAIGNYSGDAITSADQNITIGHYAGSSIISSNQNIAIGVDALKTLSTGSRSIAIGYEALKTNTGGMNTAIGWLSMNNEGVGQNNIAIGDMTMQQTEAANNNVVIGNSAGYGDSSGSPTNSGDDNTAIGYQAMQYWKQGDGNTALGYQAYQGTSNTANGNKNISIGWTAGNNLTSGSNNVVIGAADVTATGNDQLSISSGDGSPVWITGNSVGGINSQAVVVAVAGNTTLTLAQTGSYAYWTSGTLTLPASGTVGTQYTVINNTGASATVAVNATNCAMIAGFTSATNATTAIADHELASFVCVTANNWIQVG